MVLSCCLMLFWLHTTIGEIDVIEDDADADCLQYKVAAYNVAGVADC